MSATKQRHEQRKVERRRRSLFRNPQSAIRNGAAALAAAAVIAAGTVAYADPVRYDNPPGPAHFVWYGGTGGDAIGLDMVLDASSQTGAWLTESTQFGQVEDPSGNVRAFSPFNNGAFQVSGPYGDMLTGLGSGDLIPSGMPWNSSGYIWYAGAGGYSFLPDGQQTYLGVRFPMQVGGDMHYGWIGVVRQNTAELDTFAWGYETEPGVPIPAGIPEPGSLALLAFGALAVAGRRRQRGN